VQIIKARKTAGGTYIVAVHIDETKTIPDPALPVPEDGQPDTRAEVPDPLYIIEREWGGPADGQNEQEHLGGIIEEMRLLAEDELALRNAPAEPVEQVLDIEGTAL
jgi:hypothetical protein